MKILIKNGLVVNENEMDKQHKNIIIEDGVIKEITALDKIEENEFSEVIDAKGAYVLPGLVDIHVHLREPGFEKKETVKSGSMAAAAGGFTDIACMPNTSPVIDNKYTVQLLKYKIKDDAVVNVYPIGAVTKGEKGEELAEIGKMAEEGIVAISDDGKPVMSARIMKNAVEYASMFNIPVISHCEDETLVEGGQINEGMTSLQLGLKGINPLAEEVMVSREIALAAGLDTHIHLAHISTKGAIDLIRDAKKRNVKITAETCPHYFSLTEKEALGYNTYAKVNPPLRCEEDVEAVINGIKDGTLDCIVTDHAPHAVEDKNLEFDRAANGISGLETSLAATYTYLVKPGHISMQQLVEIMSKNPAKVIGIEENKVTVGAKANLTIFNPDSEWTVDSAQFYSKGKNTPFNGKKLYGTVETTIVNGKKVYSRGMGICL